MGTSDALEIVPPIVSVFEESTDSFLFKLDLIVQLFLHRVLQHHFLPLQQRH